MRKIVVSEYVSLDGVMEEPGQWSMPFWNDEIAEYKNAELLAADSLLLGRVSYEAFAAVWPGMTDEAGFADRVNGMAKHVASRTLTELSWNASRLGEAPHQLAPRSSLAAMLTDDDLVRAIQALRAGDGGDVLVWGSQQLVSDLLRLDLVDELNLLLYPLTLGAGRRLLDDGIAATLSLADVQTFSTGVLALNYRPVRQQA